LTQLDESWTEPFEIFGELFRWCGSARFFRNLVGKDAVFEACRAD